MLTMSTHRAILDRSPSAADGLLQKQEVDFTRRIDTGADLDDIRALARRALALFREYAGGRRW